MTETTTKPLILIVDDTPTNIQVLVEALRPDYRVEVAPNGKAAFEVIAKRLPDLILLDVMMPELDGYEVCRRLKAQPETREIPVIFITAKSDELDEEQGLRLGAVDYITKPFHLPIVIARVRNHINLKIKSDLLETMAMVDRLTNIPNRRRFDASLEDEWRRAQRNGTPLSLLMIDIDHFKDYNDHHGHSAGDECLKKIAASLSSAIDRPGDLVARWGGEEFIAILPDTDPNGAQQIAELMRVRVEGMAIPHGHSDTSPSVTVSIGVAGQEPWLTDSANGLIEEADRMLFQAKKTGRNRVAE